MAGRAWGRPAAAVAPVGSVAAGDARSQQSSGFAHFCPTPTHGAESHRRPSAHVGRSNGFGRSRHRRPHVPSLLPLFTHILKQHTRALSAAFRNPSARSRDASCPPLPPPPPRQFLSGAALLRIALQTRPRRSSLSARCCCNSGFSKLRLSGRRQEIRVTLATAVPCLLSRSVTSRGRRGSGPGPGGAEVSRSVAVCAALRRPHAEPPRFLPISAVSLSVFLSYRGARASCFQNIRAVSLLAGDKWKCLQPSFGEELKQGFFFSSCSPEEVTPRRSAGSPEANPRLCPSPAGGAEREGSLLQTAALA